MSRFNPPPFQTISRNSPFPFSGRTHISAFRFSPAASDGLKRQGSLFVLFFFGAQNVCRLFLSPSRPPFFPFSSKQKLISLTRLVGIHPPPVFSRAGTTSLPVAVHSSLLLFFSDDYPGVVEVCAKPDSSFSVLRLPPQIETVSPSVSDRHAYHTFLSPEGGGKGSFFFLRVPSFFLACSARK